MSTKLKQSGTLVLSLVLSLLARSLARSYNGTLDATLNSIDTDETTSDELYCGRCWQTCLDEVAGRGASIGKMDAELEAELECDYDNDGHLFENSVPEEQENELEQAAQDKVDSVGASRQNDIKAYDLPIQPVPHWIYPRFSFISYEDYKHYAGMSVRISNGLIILSAMTYERTDGPPVGCGGYKLPVLYNYHTDTNSSEFQIAEYDIYSRIRRHGLREIWPLTKYIRLYNLRNIVDLVTQESPNPDLMLLDEFSPPPIRSSHTKNGGSLDNCLLTTFIPKAYKSDNWKFVHIPVEFTRNITNYIVAFQPKAGVIFNYYRIYDSSPIMCDNKLAFISFNFNNPDEFLALDLGALNYQLSWYIKKMPDTCKFRSIKDLAPVPKSREPANLTESSLDKTYLQPDSLVEVPGSSSGSDGSRRRRGAHAGNFKPKHNTNSKHRPPARPKPLRRPPKQSAGRRNSRKNSPSRKPARSRG